MRCRIARAKTSLQWRSTFILPQCTQSMEGSIQWKWTWSTPWWMARKTVTHWRLLLCCLSQRRNRLHSLRASTLLRRVISMWTWTNYSRRIWMSTSTRTISPLLPAVSSLTILWPRSQCQSMRSTLNSSGNTSRKPQGEEENHSLKLTWRIPLKDWESFQPNYQYKVEPLRHSSQLLNIQLFSFNLKSLLMKIS